MTSLFRHILPFWNKLFQTRSERLFPTLASGERGLPVSSLCSSLLSPRFIPCDFIFFFFSPGRFYVSHSASSLNAAGANKQLPHPQWYGNTSHWFHYTGFSVHSFVDLFSKYSLNISPVSGTGGRTLNELTTPPALLELVFVWGTASDEQSEKAEPTGTRWQWVMGRKN